MRPFSPWTDRLGGARLLHLFGMSREGLELARVARARRVPVVLSPICWYDPRSLAALAVGRLAAARDLAKWAVLRASPRWPTWRRALLQLADAILPNSRAEALQLVRTFGADPDRLRVVPNGVDPRFAGATPDLFRALHGGGDFVLYVGRIEPRKNVKGLIAAVRKAGMTMVVIGDAPPGRESYLSACRAAGAGSVRWLPAVDHDDPVLASAYAAARVVALPSWFETPGLVALEAALAGRAVVVTPYGCTREYFGNRVEYARPDRPAELVRGRSSTGLGRRGPTRGWRGTSSGGSSGRKWPSKRRRSMTSSQASAVSGLPPRPVRLGRYRYSKLRWRVSVRALDLLGALAMWALAARPAGAPSPTAPGASCSSSSTTWATRS